MQVVKSCISAIVIILLIFGVKSGFEFISSLNPFINQKIAFAGFISFAIVGGIMTIGRRHMVKLGGSILYAVVLFIVGFILF